MERRGLRGHAGAVESAVAVRRVSGCRMRRLVDEVRVIVEEGGGTDTTEEEEGRVARGRGVNEPIVFTMSPARTSVYAQSSHRMTVRRSSPGSSFAVKIYFQIR